MKSEVEEIYRGLPTIECDGRCYQYCGRVMAAPIELNIIRQSTGKPALLLDATDPVSVLESVTSRSDHPVVCPYLKEKRCSIYQVRPAICRLFGVAEGLECPFGCKRKGRLLTEAEASAVLKRLEEIESSGSNRFS